MKTKKKICFVFWEGYLDVAPTVIALITHFAEAGSKVDVYLGGATDFSEEWLRDKGVKLKRIDTSSIFLNIYKYLFSNGIVWRLWPKICLKVNEQITYLGLSRFAKALTGTYDFVFCVDATGAFAYSKSNLETKKAVYVSLEVLELKGSSAGYYYNLIKESEKKLLRRKDVSVLIQDKYRCAYLEQTLGYRIASVHYLPNTVRKDNTVAIKGRYFHELFGLMENTRVILSAGMISESVCSLEISEIIGAWQTDLQMAVVFHERLDSKGNSSYHKKIIKAGNGKIRLSLKPVPFDQLPKIFSSADVGLAIYSKAAGDNFSIIGSASGKLFQYLKYGMPVIVNDLPGLSDLVEKYQAGVVVNSLNEIPTALETIFSDYDCYSRNARRAFEEDLHMDIYLQGMNKILLD